MQALKIIFLILAIIAVPVVSFALVRLLHKMSRGLSHINRTIDDARPQVNLLLSNLNHTVENVNGELDKVGRLTEQAQGMLERTDKSLSSVEKALSSRTARYGGMLAGYYTTSALVRRILRK
ncbi:MAG: hypothetical protein A2W01_05740 [Candidatus Solincola sediminis]|uniref:DUF948 domain-containing protein n=1 Tax=Candidatus Solincola sediminis TaxID=1797199 RepID=A0A1F2WGF3_9ACTN|nr:MAG: hypothetical protein A2Y75_04280 [Candidatus Solincola sediminis]OFW56234.1 MAG: hypothetical protein A2W01_05740 [Candidatus Solincola sediminis]